MRYENLTAILTKAIQEIATISGAFRANLTAFLADATNGIHDLFTDAIHAKNNCASPTCASPGTNSSAWCSRVKEAHQGREPPRQSPHPPSPSSPAKR